MTSKEDGSERETKVWLVVVDGQGYIRTSQGTTWGGNVERNPDIALRIEGSEYPLRAVFVEDAAGMHNEAAWSAHTGEWLQFLFGEQGAKGGRRPAGGGKRRQGAA